MKIHFHWPAFCNKISSFQGNFEGRKNSSYFLISDYEAGD